MVFWPFRKKKWRLPSYSLLEAVPSRGLPQDLTEREKSEDFIDWSRRIGSGLLDQTTDENTPIFATFLKFGDGLLQIQVPELKGRCLLVFSSQLRAADYARIQMPGEKFERCCSTPAQAVMVIQQCCEDTNTSDVALDRCPRCDVLTALSVANLDTADKLIHAWKLLKAVDIARCDLYWNYARIAAREDNLVVARDVALQLVGHVTAEDPRTHLLLGKLAIRLRDQQLLREARSFLDLLKQPAVQEELKTAEKTSDWQF